MLEKKYERRVRFKLINNRHFPKKRRIKLLNYSSIVETGIKTEKYQPVLFNLQIR